MGQTLISMYNDTNIHRHVRIGQNQMYEWDKNPSVLMEQKLIDVYK